MEPRDHKWHATLEGGTDVAFKTATVDDKYEIRYDHEPYLDYAEGKGEYASPVPHFICSLAACQMAVLERCLRKARIDDFHLDAEVYTEPEFGDDVPEEMPGNTSQRIRHIGIDMAVTVPEGDEARARRCLEVYDEGCIVGQSLRAGVEYTPSTTLNVDTGAEPAD